MARYVSPVLVLDSRSDGPPLLVVVEEGPRGGKTRYPVRPGLWVLEYGAAGSLVEVVVPTSRGPVRFGVAEAENALEAMGAAGGVVPAVEAQLWMGPLYRMLRRAQGSPTVYVR